VVEVQVKISFREQHELFKYPMVTQDDVAAPIEPLFFWECRGSNSIEDGGACKERDAMLGARQHLSTL